MSRYVKPVVEGTAQAQAGGEGDLQRYLSRVASYIPAETTAFYGAVTGALMSQPAGSVRLGGGILAFVAGTIFAGWPLYGEGSNDPPEIRRKQVLIASALFPFWAYALNTGIVADLHIYNIVFALVLLFIASMFAGRYSPRKPAPPVQAAAGV